MTKNEFIALLRRQMDACPYKHWRKGQVAFNVLYMLRPKLANRVRATELDPFYHDDTVAVARFIAWVHSHYNEDTENETSNCYDYDDS